MRRSRRKKTVPPIRYFFRYLNAGVVVCCFAGTGFVLGAMQQLNHLMPQSDDLWDYRPRLSTEIYSTEVNPDGTESHQLLAKVFDEDREPVELKDVPEELIQASIAIEDRRFYSHRGISPRDMLRAAWVDLRHQDVKQGASTITQQLVRNVWLSQERTWDRKVKEAVLALEMERKYSKDEIMEMYLNQVCYGHGAFGVKTAAKLYYHKAPKDLKLHEAAMLAGMPQWPVGYSPYRYPDRCRQRRNAVLRAMAEEGFITEAERSKASKVPIKQGLKPLQERGVVSLLAPHFTNWVLRELTREYGDETVYQGGLRVYTTLDTRLQKIAEKELTQQVERLRRSGAMKPGVRGGQGAMVCVEVKTGRVLAMVGGVGEYKQVQTNRAHPGPPGYGRQPGSSFKPYIWACAVENGYGPDSVFSADPIDINGWSPKNYSPRQGGTYTLRNALRDSVNLVSVRLVLKLSVPKVVRFAARMLNIPRERLDPYPAIALGVSNVSPLEQALGYCAFANNGLRPTCRYVRRIEDQEGRVLVTYQPELERVIRSTTAQSMLSMLQTVVQSGTGTRARACGRPAGGKTGTTNSACDVWWVGFTPELSAAVWLGNERPSRLYGASGGGWGAPVWASFIKQASEILGCDGEFPQGPGATAVERGEPAKREGTRIEVCVETGLRAGPHCPARRAVWIKQGEEIPGVCDVHTKPGGNQSLEIQVVRPDTAQGGTVTRRICISTGQLAGPGCPSTRTATFPSGEQPTSRCSLHGGGSGGGHGRPEGNGGSPAVVQPERPEGGAGGGATSPPPETGPSATPEPPADKPQGQPAVPGPPGE